MNLIEKMTRWGDSHHPVWLDVFRIILGAIIFWKGLEFSQNPQGIKEVIAGADLSFLSYFVVTWIPMFHLAGGLLIAIGLITRVAALVQLPVVIGAIVLTAMTGNLAALALACVVLILLGVFLVCGSGKFSMDEYLSEGKLEDSVKAH